MRLNVLNRFLLFSFIVFWSTSFYKKQSDNSRVSTGKDRIAAFEIQQKMLKESVYNNIHWRLIGPDTRSGRSTEVCGISGNNKFIIAAFATGGIWKTEDAGSNWKPVFDKEGTQSIGAIEIAPSDSNTIYAGTGEANIFRASLPGIGIYKSTDKGETWKHSGLENTGTIARIVIHPENKNIVYVAASGNEWSENKDRGVYKSADGGKTWNNILYENEKSGCIDIVIDPKNPEILYASMWKRIRKRWSDPIPENGDHIYKSTDGGNTWKILQNGLPDTKYTGRIGLAISHINSSVLYALVDNHTIKREPKDGEMDSYGRKAQRILVGADIYKSSDGGETWQQQAQIHDFVVPFSGTYGWVFGQIRINPHNDNKLYALGVNLATSDDGGKTWRIAEATDTTSEWTHGDNHDLWFDLKDTSYILLANDGGVCASYNSGNKWYNFFDKIPTTQFYTVTYDMATPFNVYGSVQDEGTMYGSVDNTYGTMQDLTKQAWDYAAGGEGTQIRVHPDSTHIIFSSSYYGRLMRSDMRLADSIRSKNIAPEKTEKENELRGEWLAGTILSPFDPNTIYHGMQYVYKSVNGGESWSRISADLTDNDTNKMGRYPYVIFHQAITALNESELKKGILYAGTDDGKVWITKDDGMNWKNISKGLYNNAHVSSIAASKHEQAKIYVTLSDRREDNIVPYIYRSDDYGNTWTSIASNLPHSPVNVVIEDPDDVSTIYCGTDMGIYTSKNEGKNWVAINANMPASISVNDIFIHPRDKKLVVGTYGRGVYVLDEIHF